MDLATVLSPILIGVGGLWLQRNWELDFAPPDVRFQMIQSLLPDSIQYFSLRSRFSILPAAFLGRESTNSTDLGDL